jgi:benzylsuccinate CoA-transferase BbsE subunit
MPADQDGAVPVQAGAPRPLAAYRMVELPGAPQLPAGKTFADLGADVIKVEPPGGDPARTLPPLAQGKDGSALGLYWAAYSLDKRSVTADLETEEGRALFRRLIATADVVIESYAPGEMERLGLDYERLRAENPGLVLTSITPFGQTGPYAGWKGSDLVQFAMGGYLYMTGPKDDTPIKPSAPYQTWLFGSMHAVSATLLALRQRKRTGQGAHVDAAMRDTGMWMLTHTYQFWDMMGINLTRHGAQRDVGGAVRLPHVYHCLDGYVVWMFQTGQRGKTTRTLVDWMAEHGMAPDWLQEQDWDSFDLVAVDPALLTRMAETFAAFFATKRKAEMLEWAIAKGVMLAPLQNLRDLMQDTQLAARQTWRTVQLGVEQNPVRVPGPPIRLSDGAWEPRGAPPSLGEHNAEIYRELGLSTDEIARLSGSAVA